VETKQEIREFLTSRRARITPQQAGLQSYGSRRVPGLRREEVAVLAGVSVPYYTRLERGDANGVSDSVLDALARALELDDAERAHLFDLVRAAQPTPARPRRRQAKQRVRPEVQWTLDAITGAAAFVSNERLDILVANQLGRALFSELYAAPARPVNSARFVFLDPRAEAYFGDWDRVANESVAILRSAAGRDPYNRDLSDLVGRARHTERGIPYPLGHTQRPLPQHRRQALQPSRRRRAPPDVQPAGPRRRPWVDDVHLHRRARLSLRGSSEAPRQLGGHRRPRRDHKPALSSSSSSRSWRILVLPSRFVHSASI
jgi:transcriptional regulator with XRE-family HTH domain